MVTSDDDQPVVLLIGTVDREGVVSAVKSAGLRYSVKRIDSSPRNWQSICALFSENVVRCALLKLTATTYSHLASEEYADIREELLSRIAAARHAVYVYEDLYSGAAPEVESPVIEGANASTPEIGYDDFFDEPLEPAHHSTNFFAPPPDRVREAVNTLLEKRGIDVVPYRTNAELSVLATNFVADSDSGLLFRVYLPNDRIWANETDRLLTLFRDYLCNVGHRDVRLNQTRTRHGVIYEFFATDPNGVAPTAPTFDLSSEFREFSDFLDLSLRDADGAGKVLRSHGVSSEDIARLLTRYAKEARRIQVDLRHEREQKVLSIRQRLESELFDELPAQIDEAIVLQLVDAAVPPLAGLASPLTARTSSLQISAGKGSHLVVNVKPQIVSSVNAIVAQEVNGEIHLTEQDHRILKLVREHAPDRAMELESAVREVADDTVPKPERLLSARRLKGFLVQLATKVPDVGAGLLQAYLENRLGL